MFAIFLGMVLWLCAVQIPVLAEGNPETGAKVFAANCAACHAGGGNIVIANKTLKKAALTQYQMDNLGAIATQVTNGKNAMPKFAGRLNAQQIEDVAAYVLSKAEKGW
ncbi:MAG: cytochrome c6 PetJ [Microcoleaceae cyanobacterium]